MTSDSEEGHGPDFAARHSILALGHSMPAVQSPSSTGSEKAVRTAGSAVSESPPGQHHNIGHHRSWNHHSTNKDEMEGKVEDMGSNIYLHSTSKQAHSMIAPFLAQHIPRQYNPTGTIPKADDNTSKSNNSSNTKYCYRHRPDLKCRRQAAEPTMDQLQKELGALSQSDQQGIAHVWSLFSAAPAKHRELMLQGILTQCCFPQLSFISASVRDLIKIDFLSALPPELGFKVLCYLDTASLCKAAQVSRRWRTLADDDVVWHKMCEQHIDRKCVKCGWGLPLLEQKRLRSEKRQIQLRATGRGLNEWSPNITPLPDWPPSLREQRSREASARASPAPLSLASKRPLGEDATEVSAKRACRQSTLESSDSYFPPPVTRPWKDVYKDRFKVGINWRHGRCSTKVFKGHTNGVMCLQFDDSILATGSYDCTVKIWDIQTGEEIRTLVGHTSGVRCLQFDGTRLFSGSLDHKLKIWNWRTGECVTTFTGPADGILSLHFSGTFLACGSKDHNVRVWNLETKCTFLLRGHTDWVNCVKIDYPSRTLFSSGDDCVVRLWDLDTRSCLKVFRGHTGQIQQVIPLPRGFEYSEDASNASEYPQNGAESSDSESDAESFASGTTRHSRNNIMVRTPSGSLPAAESPPEYILTGALDGTIRLWHVPTGRTIRVFFGHVEGVWGLAADTLRFVSGAEDRTIKVWDPRTGACEKTFTGHLGPVTCVGLSDSKLVSGSEDCEVRVHSFQTELLDEGASPGSEE